MKYYIYQVGPNDRESPSYVVKLTRSGAKFCSYYNDWHDVYHLAMGLYNQNDDSFIEVTKDEAVKILASWGRQDLEDD